ncbi:MAG: hypothetical protein R3B72_41445 [Polyangiaceae bacterium]
MNLHLLASFSLWDRLNLSLDMPFALLQRGNAIGPGGVLLDDAQPADGAAVGDLRFGARGSIFGEDGAPFQLGVGGYLWLPTGASNDYVSDKTVRGSVEALLGGTVGRSCGTSRSAPISATPTP